MPLVTDVEKGSDDSIIMYLSLALTLLIFEFKLRRERRIMKLLSDASETQYPNFYMAITEELAASVGVELIVFISIESLFEEKLWDRCKVGCERDDDNHTGLRR